MHVVLSAFGLCATVCHYPGVDGDGLRENTIDSLVMLGNNLVLLALVVIFTLLVLVCNISGPRQSRRVGEGRGGRSGRRGMLPRRVVELLCHHDVMRSASK